MTSERFNLKGHSSNELLLLHAVRLAGFADTDAIAARAGLAADIVGDTLRVLEGQHLIERMAFADSGGWILTEAGKSRDGELLQEELEASGARPVLQATAENFESSVNPRLVRAVTDWQLHSSADRTDRSVEVLWELTTIGEELSDLMAELAAQLPRFGRYPRQFSAALEKARAGDDQWVAGVRERHRCSTKTIWRRIWQGGLPAHTEKVSGRDGRPVIKTLVRVSDLNDAFGRAAQDEHVQRVREAAPPLTHEQVTVIGEVLLDQLRDRDSKRRSYGGPGASA